MRLPFLILVFALGACLGCGHYFNFRTSDTLRKSNQGTINVETWQGDSWMEQPVWKTCLQENGSTNIEVLFTVASVFQKSQPGYPHFVVTNGVEIIQDSARSYIYSLASRHFITNAWPGDYRDK